MIFSDYPQAVYPQLFVACAVIPGIFLGEVGNRGERFLDNKRVEGNIEEMLEGTLNFLENNMRKAVIIDSNTAKRKDVLEYPMLALREAIANALIHRDYSSKTENAYIQVYMYSDRIVIQNPGSLYGINKLEKLGTDTIMESRNPNIVRVLEDKGSVIENRHSGIPTMKREMRKLGLPDPEFEEERGTFKVTFRKSNNKNGSAQVQASNINNMSKRVLEFCVEPKSIKEILKFLNLKSREYLRKNIIVPLIKSGKLKYTNEKSINASNQKYVTRK